MIQMIRALWPADEPAPLLRLLRALILAPSVLSVLLAIGAFLIAGMAEARRQDAIAAALDSSLSLTALVFLFTLTFGVVGIVVLGAAGLRGLLIWAMTGGLLGAAGGLLFGIAMNGTPNRVLIVVAAVLGWVLFLLLRWFGGIRTPTPTRRR